MSVPDPWAPLRELTAARIALGSAGAGLPTARHLEFQADHARARDAVHAALDADALAADLSAAGLDVIHLHSAAPDRATYLQRPDLGRRLDGDSRARLEEMGREGCDAVFVVADGLSAHAVQRHAAPVLAEAAARLRAAGWRMAPIIIVRQGRVAIGDEIGALLGAKLAAVLIGERPGLSAPDSLGVYLTHDPRPGRVDAERNCISNIRAAGLKPSEAAGKLLWLLAAARRLGATGVALKDEQPAQLEGSATPAIEPG
jgi:ethanolamine ammonia-lyase small subunit